MAITTESGLLTGLAVGPQMAYLKLGITSKGAGTFSSLWTATGQPGAGAAPASPTTGVVPTSATAGAMTFSNPTSPALSYAGKLALSTTAQSYFTLYDRLWHVSGISATLTTAQNITFPGLTRWTTGDQVELWVEIYTATTAAATATISYTNQAGTSGRSTTVAIPAATIAGQMVPVPLASGDTGVRAVASTTLSGSLTAGNWGLTMVRDVASLSIPSANMGVFMNAYDLGMMQIADNACLTWLCLNSAATTPSITGELVIAQG